MTQANRTEKGERDLTMLQYPNQFVLGPAFIEPLSEWKQLRVNDDLCLMVYPGMDVCRAEANNKSIILIGYILNSQRPDADNEQIISELLDKLKLFDGFHEQTNRFGGRWVMIVDDGQSVNLLNDAAGHRQVFYAEKNGQALWCASQPRILAEITDRRMSQDAVDFINTYEFRKNVEYRWPGHGSPYCGIFHLLPNHYLNLGTGVSKRYWPNRPLPSVPLEQAVESVSKTLKGLMEAASHRFDLVISLTAGLDSRTVLAASSQVVANSPVMTVRQIDKPTDHADVQVASQLATMLNLQHDVVQSSLIIDDDFLYCFKQNTALPHYIYVPDAHAIYQRYQRKRVVVTGSISEIGRLSFRAQLGKPESEPIDAHDLARLQKMGLQPYAVKAFDRWLSGVGDSYNIPILDLFEWEQGHGNWLSMCHMEFDIAWKDLFSPFNCRELLMLMLSVDSRQRGKPENLLYRGIIETLWPALLTIPVNPHDKHKKKLIQTIRQSIPYPIKKSLKRFLGK